MKMLHYVRPPFRRATNLRVRWGQLGLRADSSVQCVCANPGAGWGGGGGAGAGGERRGEEAGGGGEECLFRTS